MKEFQARTEEEAIEKAEKELDLTRDNFEFEIIEKDYDNITIKIIDKEQEIEEKDILIIDFIKTILFKMGFSVEVKILYKTDDLVSYDIIYKGDPSLLIGRNGQNINSLEKIINAFNKDLYPNKYIELDTGEYRLKKEDYFIKTAHITAMKVKKNKKYILLNKLSPSERKMMHTLLNKYKWIQTESLGDTYLKQIKVSYKNS